MSSIMFCPRAWSRSLPFEGYSDSDSEYVCYIWTKITFFAVYLTFVQFNLRLKFCLYIIVHLLLEEFRFPLKSSFIHNHHVTHCVLESESESDFGHGISVQVF